MTPLVTTQISVRSPCRADSLVVVAIVPIMLIAKKEENAFATDIGANFVFELVSVEFHETISVSFI